MSSLDGYRLTDVRPGFARVMRADGGEVGEVTRFTDIVDGYYAWDVVTAAGVWLFDAARTRRLAVAALIETDMAQQEHNNAR